MMYRKDLFDDPKEKVAFKAKYGRDLNSRRLMRTRSKSPNFLHGLTRVSMAGARWGTSLRLCNFGLESVPLVLWRRTLESEYPRG